MLCVVSWHSLVFFAACHGFNKTVWQFPMDFPGVASGKEPTYQCRRHKRCRLDPWVGKIPWRTPWQPTPVFLPGESPWTEEPGGLQSIGSHRVRHDYSDLACMHARGFNKTVCQFPTITHWGSVAVYELLLYSTDRLRTYTQQVLMHDSLWV